MDVESLDRSRMEIEMSLMGIDEMHTLIYTRDGYQYTELTEMGQTTRTRLSVDSISIDEMVAFMETNDLFDIAESWVESSSVVSTNDGYRLEFENWWFNIRPSNTEPYLRLLIEAKTEDLLNKKRREIEVILSKYYC
jgi:phosphomannomutase